MVPPVKGEVLRFSEGMDAESHIVRPGDSSQPNFDAVRTEWTKLRGSSKGSGCEGAGARSGCFGLKPWLTPWHRTGVRMAAPSTPPTWIEPDFTVPAVRDQEV